MTRSRQWALMALFVTLAMAGGYALLLTAGSSAPAQVGTGAPAPDFRAQTLDSVPRTRSLADYHGAPLLLNVWATWCDPCREEMPSMQRLYDAYKDRGLRIAAVSIDDRGNEELIREFVAEHRLTFDILYDSTSAIMTTYQVRGVPQTFLISSAGTIAATRFVADWTTPESRKLVEQLLSPVTANR